MSIVYLWKIDDGLHMLNIDMWHLSNNAKTFHE